MQNATAIGLNQGWGIVRAMYVAYALMALVLLGTTPQFTTTRVIDIGARVAAHESFIPAALVSVRTTEIGGVVRSPETAVVGNLGLLQKPDATR